MSHYIKIGRDCLKVDTPIKKMLVAIDGSKAAAKALNYVLSLAEKCDAEARGSAGL